MERGTSEAVTGEQIRHLPRRRAVERKRQDALAIMKVAQQGLRPAGVQSERYRRLQRPPKAGGCQGERRGRGANQHLVGVGILRQHRACPEPKGVARSQHANRLASPLQDGRNRVPEWLFPFEGFRRNWPNQSEVPGAANKKYSAVDKPIRCG